MTIEYSKYDDEYYLVYADDDYPMIDLDDDILSDTKNDGMFTSPWELIQDGYVFPVILSEPLPEKIEIVDYHDLPCTFSYRVIKDVAQRHGMPGVQWFPAYIHHNGQRYNDYVIMHVYKEIECLDRSQSNFDQMTKRSIDLRSIVLNKNVLDAIPLEERLIFLMAEKTSLVYMHKTIVDEILQHNPVGVRFIKSKDWGVREAFG
ncbi:imm11 family protein [Bacterioplanoides sp.]|uniref:imm11 family protein n=1 Tax=Bacterioplanoides sp. TaxID=2066072 RepID=UPI003AFFFC01